MKEDTKKVEIVKIGTQSQKSIYGTKVNMEKVAVVFLFLDNKKKRKFYMNGEGIKEGDIGTLTYQGILVRKFEREGSVYDEKKELYYHFGFSSKKKVIQEQKTRTKRKYW